MDEVIRRVTDKVVTACRKYRGQLRGSGGCYLADQDEWQEVLSSHEAHVNKLDANVWNFCPLPEVWETEWHKHRHKVRVVHLKGQGQPKRHEMPKRLLERYYGARIK
jgi:hypothetical protein